MRLACQRLIRFMAARINPRQRNAPGASTITEKGLNPSHITGVPNSVPAPNTSRMEPRKVRDMVKPSPMPRPSAMASGTVFLAAKASARPRMMQFTTMSGTKMPSCWYSG